MTQSDQRYSIAIERQPDTECLETRRRQLTQHNTAAISISLGPGRNAGAWHFVCPAEASVPRHFIWVGSAD